MIEVKGVFTSLISSHLISSEVNQTALVPLSRKVHCSSEEIMMKD